MKKKTLFILLLVVSSAYAQQRNIEDLKRDPNLYCGQGIAATLQEADKKALEDLASQIYVTVDSKVQTNLSNEQKDGVATSSITTEGSTRVTSSIAISNCSRIDERLGDNYFVLRYIQRSEIEKMYATRKTQINDLIRSAEEAEQQYKIGDMLKYYYWALKMTNSIPIEYRANLTTETGKLFTTHLNELIYAALDSIKLTLQDQKTQDQSRLIVVEAQYKGQPITQCDFSYFDGYDWIPTTAKDGIAAVEIGEDITSLPLRMEYEYQKLWKSHPEVEAILSQQPERIAFRNADKFLSVTALPEQEIAVDSKTIKGDIHTDSINVCTTKDLKQIAKLISPVLNAIETRQYDIAQPYFTSNGWKWFDKLIRYGEATIIERPEPEVSEFAEGYLLRGIKARFKFKKNDKTFVEDLVFYIKDNQVDGISFGLDKNALEDIKGHSMWSAESRQVLVNFLENYKTAYALERLDYLDAIFSDDALIIVGNKIPEHKVSDVEAINQEHYAYNRLSKSQYIKQLEKVFQKQEYVNIQFEDANVKKTSHEDERYEIIIKQNYYSATYADQGYLFLLADMSNPKRPIIHVRVWDEHKNDLMDYGEWIF